MIARTGGAVAEAATANITVSMMRGTEVGTGITAADIGPLIPHPLLHLPRVVGHLRDPQTIGEETGIVAEETLDAEAVAAMIAEAGSVEEPPQLMSIRTSRDANP